MNFLEIDKKQRAYDGKWEVIAKILDRENEYVYASESGQRISYIPERWITIDVTNVEPILEKYKK